MKWPNVNMHFGQTVAMNLLLSSLAEAAYRASLSKRSIASMVYQRPVHVLFALAGNENCLSRTALGSTCQANRLDSQKRAHQNDTSFVLQIRMARPYPLPSPPSSTLLPVRLHCHHLLPARPG